MPGRRLKTNVAEGGQAEDQDKTGPRAGSSRQYDGVGESRTKRASEAFNSNSYMAAIMQHAVSKPTPLSGLDHYLTDELEIHTIPAKSDHSKASNRVHTREESPESDVWEWPRLKDNVIPPTDLGNMKSAQDYVKVGDAFQRYVPELGPTGMPYATQVQPLCQCTADELGTIKANLKYSVAGL